MLPKKMLKVINYFYYYKFIYELGIKNIFINVS